ncbi:MULTISPECIES: terpene synthase family protein [Streptosporangium]|uniref:Terpene synthase n=1 Tax=Streptosporangium brasiliense TaxID=47480 RepID=A0ABT9RFF1_9ACTN|nr:terpene synthase family protein [Streptosporangium brasiliense]MDP9868003.1 hypothetical protein [Streptosporangium brasiliense]
MTAETVPPAVGEGPPDPRWSAVDGVLAGAVDAHGSMEVRAAADASVTAVQLVGHLRAWAGRIGLPLDPGAAALCSLTAANCTPWLSAPACSPTARTAFWLLALDAWSDGPGGDAAAVDAGVTRCLAVVDGRAPGADDPLAVALAEIRDGVRGGPSGEAVYGWWRRAATACLVGTRFERHAADAVARGGRPPLLAEYLHHATGSIGLAMTVTAAWSAMEEPDLPARLPDLWRPLRDASVAVRLANDLRGHDREQAEGTLDALALGCAPQDLVELLVRHVDRCRRRLRPLAEVSPGAAAALERHLVWSVRMYQRFDAGHTG